MKLILINSSIVLVTQDSIPPVNHDFLINKKVIPESFQKKNNSISTPVISHIHYNNGFTIVVEPKKILIQFQISSFDFDEEKNLHNLKLLKEISSNYLKLFDYIKYQAIGINFDFIKEKLQYNAFIEKFIKQDNHLSFENNRGEVLRVDLSYNLKGKQFNVNVIRAESRSQPANPQTTAPTFVPFFKINVNYPGNYAENKVTVIEELEENYNRSKEFIGKF